jgi:TPR repeat protein
MENNVPSADSAADRILSAALNGSIENQYMLATLLESGNGMEQSFSAASGWYKKAAEKGHLEAMYRLGLLYMLSGPMKDYSQAIYWLTLATERGHASSRFRLSVMYERGLGCEANHEISLKLCREAADQGSTEAIEKLDSMETWMTTSDLAAFMQTRKPEKPVSNFSTDGIVPPSAKKTSGEVNVKSFLGNKKPHYS